MHQHLITRGPIKVTPILFEAIGLAVEDVVATAAQQPLADEPVSEGWAGIPIRLGESTFPLVRPIVQRPGMSSINGLEVGCLRLLWDVEDRDVKRQFGESFDSLTPDRRYRLQAVDILLVQGEHSVYALVVSRDVDVVVRATKALRSLCEATLDISSDKESDDPPGLAGSQGAKDFNPRSDLFVWAAHRVAEQNGALSDDLTVLDYRTLQSKDRHERKERTYDGIDLSRTSFAAAVVEMHHFGPAKVTLRTDKSDSEVDLYLLSDSTFEVTRERSSLAPSDTCPTAMEGAHLILLAALEVLPAVDAAYRADVAWNSGERDAFTELCKERLRLIV